MGFEDIVVLVDAGDAAVGRSASDEGEGDLGCAETLVAGEHGADVGGDTMEELLLVTFAIRSTVEDMPGFGRRGHGDTALIDAGSRVEEEVLVADLAGV